MSFEGISDKAWNYLQACLSPLFAEENKATGRPATSLRKSIQTIAYQALTNEKWAYLPKGAEFATKSVANRVLQVLKKNAVDIEWITSFFTKK